MTLQKVTIDCGYFSNSTGRFLPVGAHWVPAQTGLQWPFQWDESSIEADFVKMKDMGFNTVRLDLFWAWFEPRPGVYNPQAYKQLDFFILLAHRYNIYLHPVLFIGGEVGEAFWDVPWRHGRNPHSDPDMLRLQTEHAGELGRRYKEESAIIAWDLTDEPPFWIVAGQTSDAMAINWTRLIAGALRRYDPRHLLCVGTAMEDVGRGPFRPDNLADEVDFFSVHPYPIYMPKIFPDPLLSERGTYCGSFQTMLSGGAGKSVMVHELGASSAQYSPEHVAAFDRTTLYSTLAAGANGFLLWCYTDASPELFSQAPYLRAPHETQFGLTTWDHKDRPAGVEFRKFTQVVAQMDLDGVEPEKPNAGLIVPFEWSKPHGDFSKMNISGLTGLPYVSIQDGGAVLGGSEQHDDEANTWLVGAWLSAFILARQAGLKVSFPREYTSWQSIPIILLPAPLTSTECNFVHVHTSFWKKIKDYLHNGGLVYASLCADTAIPGMDDLFGASLVDHTSVEECKITMVLPFGDIQPGEVFHYHPESRNPRHWPAIVDVKDGRVIAVDQNNRPALIMNSCGIGKTLVCTYPIESYLASEPGVFEKEQNSYRLYKAISQWRADREDLEEQEVLAAKEYLGVRSCFTTDQPGVEVGGLCGDHRGYAVIINHKPQDILVKISSRIYLKSAIQITPTGKSLIDCEPHNFHIIIEGFNGTVVEWMGV